MGWEKSRLLVQRVEGGPQVSFFQRTKFSRKILCQFVTNISRERFHTDTDI